MSWAHALILGCLGFALACFVCAIAGSRHGSWPRRHNHLRRDVLPPPSQKCQRGGIEALTP